MPIKVLLLNNISKVAINIFEENGYIIEDLIEHLI